MADVQVRDGRLGESTGVALHAHSSEVSKKYLAWGAGPRASQYLTLGAKCHALVNGKFSPDIEDVKAIAVPILRHRLVLNY